MKIPSEPMKCFMHCSTLSIRLVRELEMPGLFLRCISWRRSIIAGAEWKAALSSFESFDIYACIAFCSASSPTGIGGIGGWRFPECAPGAWVGPAAAWLEVAVAPLDCP